MKQAESPPRPPGLTTRAKGPATPPKTRTIPLGAFASFGIGASLLITGSVAGIRTLVQSAAVKKRCERQCFQSEIDKQVPRADLATAGIILGLAGIGGGIAWVLVDRPSADSKDSALRLSIGPGRLQLHGRF